MRCSKCQYISFDNSDRCRNCGYEFSLSTDEDVLDLPMRHRDDADGPLADLALTGPGTPTAAPTPQPAPPRRERPARSTASGELPLFRGSTRDDDAPLVSLPAVPRAPVAVRKSTVGPRPPARPPAFEELDLDLDPDDDLDEDLELEEEDGGDAYQDDEDVVVERPAAPAAHERTQADVAPIFPRLLAAIIDLVLLAGIDAAVLHLTLLMNGLEWADAAQVPIMPFGAFLALLNGGYIATFTAAGGQTIGKMLTGIRVITSEEDAWTDRVPVGPSFLRAVGYLLSALPAGLGFLPVLLGTERRGLHDRLAHTRVVKT